MLESLNTDVFEYEKLKPEEMQRRGILGRLVGVMADTVNPTRNGRSYSGKLWDNVFNNPIMKERIENNCCFGELGHPTDREETDMSKIAICMDGMPKKDKNGKLQAVFNILDTPNGRILKSLCDYGCNIGISSRGSGDLITDFDGNESVDPDTYNCEGWDAVIIPAVKEARLTYVTEALDKKRYNKSLRTKLQEAIDKETDDNKRIMTESLGALGITLHEDNNSNPDDFFYKGIEIIKDPKSGKFVCEIDGDSFAFNNEKNAKLWVDINIKEPVTKSTYINKLSYNTQKDIENELSKVVSDEDVQRGMAGKLSDLEDTIDISKYLTEEQVGRDNIKDDKDVDDVMKPEVDDNETKKDEEDDETKVTVTINESVDWTDLNGTEQFAVDRFINALNSNEIRPSKDEFDYTVRSIVDMYGDANAYLDPDDPMYHEEGSYGRVKDYLLNNSYYADKIKQYFGFDDALNESLNTYSVEFTYDSETDDRLETFIGHVNVKASSENEAIEKAKTYVNSNKYTNSHPSDTNFRNFNISNNTYTNVDLVEDVDDINAARMQLCQVLDDWYRDNIANERAEDVKLSGWDSDLQSKYLDFRNYLAPDLIQDMGDNNVVDNIETDLDSLQEMLEYNKTLENKIISLNEKLSVSHAMEKTLNDEIRSYKDKISTLSKNAKDTKVLTEQLTAVKDSAAVAEKKLNESNNKFKSRIKSLKENLANVTKERDTNASELRTLREDYEILNKDLVQTKEQFSSKFEKQNKLLEKYQKITQNAIDRYINIQANNLGVKPVEIKNRLSESFTFNDIDSVCEDLREYKLNVSMLPFNTNRQLAEGVNVKANNIGRNSLLPKNELDELTDYDFKLMEAYL